MTFRLGGKDMPYGKLELAYTGAGPAEQVKALARLQGCSIICAIHDECGNHFDSTFVDMAAATLRGPAWASTRMIRMGELLAVPSIHGCRPVMASLRGISNRGRPVAFGVKT